MEYLGKILSLCLIVFGAFALYKYAPFLISEAIDGANNLASLVSSL
jgi:hypothetical protein